MDLTCDNKILQDVRELIKDVILPRIDQLEDELRELRRVTWPVCQSLRETSQLTDLKNKKYDIYIPNEEFNMGGYNDQLAIGTLDTMKIYSDTFFNLNKFAHELGRWHPETFLGKQLKDNNIKVHQTNLDYRLVRNVNVETHWPENPYKFLNL